METLLYQFKSFLQDQPSGRQINGSSKGLSKISVKNYASDLRRFLEWFTHTYPELHGAIPHRLSSDHVNSYLAHLQAQNIPQTTITRYLSSLRRFITFIELTYNLPPLIIPTHLGASIEAHKKETSPDETLVNSFRQHLKQLNFSDSTVKNYVSDLKHFLTWNANGPKLQFLEAFTPQAQETYSNYLKVNNTPSSTLSRRLSTLRTFTTFAQQKNLLPTSKDDSFAQSTVVEPLRPPVTPQYIAPLFVSNSSWRSSRFPLPLALATLLLLTGFMGYRLLRSPFSPLSSSQQELISFIKSHQLEVSPQGTIKIPTDSISLIMPFLPQYQTISGEVAGVNTQGGSDVHFGGALDENFNLAVTGYVEGDQLRSTTTTKPPLVVASSLLVNNLNADLLDGFHADTEAGENEIPAIDETGAITFTASNPRITSDNSLGLSTNFGSDGSINLSTDGSGSVNILTNNTGGQSLLVNDAQLSSGSLIRGQVGNNNTGYNFLTFAGGAGLSTRFSVNAIGDLFFAGTLSDTYATNIPLADASNTTLPAGTTSILDALDAVAVGSNFFTDGGTYLYPTNRESLRVYDSGGTDYADLSHDGSNALLTFANTDSLDIRESVIVDSITVDGTTTLNNITYTWPSTQTASYLLQTDGSGSLSWVAAPNSSDWTKTAGVIHPIVTTDDLAIGGTTSSAPFFVDDSGNLTVDGNLTLGDSAADTITINALLGADFNLNNFLLLNIGASGTDFTTGGGLNIAGTLDPTNVAAFTLTGNITGNDQSILDLDTLSTNIIQDDEDSVLTINDSLNILTDLDVDGTTTLSTLGAGATNTVLTHNSGLVESRTIDSRVWGATLIDGTGSTGFLARWSDTDTLTNSVVFDDGTNVGIGDITPASLLTVGNGDLFQINSSGQIVSIDGVAHTIDDISGNLTLTSNSSTISLNDSVTFASTTTLNGITYTWPGSQGTNYLLQTNGSGTLSWIDPATLATAQYWTQANGALYPVNATVDVLIGSTATTSAKFAFINVNSGTPTASISGTTANVATYITGEGNLQVTNRQNLTLGGSTTGQVNILDRSGTAFATFDTLNSRLGLGTISPAAKIDSLSTTEQLRLSYDASNYSAFTTSLAGDLTIAPSGGDTNITGTLTTSGDLAVNGDDITSDGTLTITPTTTLTLNSTGDMTLDSSTDIILDADGSDVLFKDGGTTFATFTNSSTDLTLTIAGGNFLSSSALNFGGAAAAAYNFFASDISGVSTPDGVADLYIQDELEVDGTVRFNNLTYTFPATQTTNYILQTDGSGVLSWVDPAVAAGSSVFWTQANGALFPKNSTVDVLIGSNATTSAKFAFINVNSGTPTASISGTTSNVYTYLTGEGNLQVTNRQDLTLGGSTTGQVQVLNRSGSNFTTFDTLNSRVGIGLSSPATQLDILTTNAVGGGIRMQSSLSDATLKNARIKVGHYTNSEEPVTMVLATSNTTATDLFLGGGSSVENAVTTIALYTAANNTTTTGTEALRVNSSQNVGIGTGATVNARLHSLSTSEQLRLGYDTTNFSSFIVSLAGDLTIAPSGGDTNITGTLTTSGDIAVNGDDITSDGTLTITPTTTLTLNSTGDLTLDSSTDIILDADGADVVLKDAGVTYATLTNSSTDLTLTIAGGNFLSSSALNFGGAAAAAYNYFASDISGVSTPDGVADLYIQDELEVDGTIRLNNITYTFPTTQSSNYILQTDGSGVLSWVDATVAGAGTDYWDQANGALYPKNATVDLLVGGSASTSAKFSFINVNSGTPTASISGTTANVYTYLTGEGNLQVTNRQNLTLAGSTTGQVQVLDRTGAAFTTFDTLNSFVGIGTSTPVGELEVVSASTGNANRGIKSAQYSSSIHAANMILQKARGTAGTPLTVADADFLGQVAFSGYGTSFTNRAAIQALVNGTVAANSVPTDLLFLTGATSGTEKLRITSDGNVHIRAQGDLRLDDTDSSNYTGFQAPAALGGNIVYTLPSADGTIANQVLATNALGTLSWIDVSAASGGGGSDLWSITDNLLHPKHYGVWDLAIGGNATSSAPFHVNHINGTISILDTAGTSKHTISNVSNNLQLATGSNGTKVIIQPDLQVSGGDILNSSGQTHISLVPESTSPRITNITGILTVDTAATFSAGTAADKPITVRDETLTKLWDVDSEGQFTSYEANGGSAIAFEFDTANTLTTSGAKLLSVQNANTEYFYVDKDGNVWAKGSIYADRGFGVFMKNISGTTLSQYDLIVIADTEDASDGVPRMTTTTTPYDKKGFGVVQESCADQATCKVVIQGKSLINMADETNRGDYLFTSATAGKGTSSTMQYDGLVGVATTTDASDPYQVEMVFLHQPAISKLRVADKNRMHADYHEAALDYDLTNETNYYEVDENIRKGLLFDTFSDKTKIDTANSTLNIDSITFDNDALTSGSNKIYTQGRIQLAGGITFNATNTDTEGSTYLGTADANDVYYYDRSQTGNTNDHQDSTPATFVDLGLDPNWYNGVTLDASASGILTSPPANLSTTYNGALIKASGTYASGEEDGPIIITIVSDNEITSSTPTVTFNWRTNGYSGTANHSGTAVTTNKGVAYTLETGTGDITITFTNATYHAGDIFKIASWYMEPETANDRGPKQQFPQRSYIIVNGAAASTNYMDIIDADTNKLWMRFTGGSSGTDFPIISGTNPLNSVHALNGSLYMTGTDNQGLRTVKFNQDTAYYMDSALADHRIWNGEGQSGLYGRNNSGTFNENWTPIGLIALAASPTNDAHAAVVPNHPTKEVTVSGWGYIQGDDTRLIEETVAFPYRFSSTPRIITNAAGAKGTTAPNTIEECVAGVPNSASDTVTNSSFIIELIAGDAAETLTSTNFFCYTWTATGIVAPQTMIGVATDAGISVVNETNQAVNSYSDVTGDDYNQVWLATNGQVYGTNETQAQLERWNNIASNTTSELNDTPDKIWDDSTTNLPAIANTTVTINAAAADSLAVTENTSPFDIKSHTVYLAHNLGLTKIEDVDFWGTDGDGDDAAEGSSTYYNNSYITEEMIGSIRGSWPLNDASGSLDDASVRNNFLEDENAPTYGVTGVRGTGLTFNGSADYLCSDSNNDATCDSDTDYDIGTGSFSVSTWFKTSASGLNQYIVDRHITTSQTVVAGWIIFMNTSNQITFQIDDDSSFTPDDEATSTQAYNDGQWHHITAVKNGTSSIHLYIDGQQVDNDLSLTATGSLSGTSNIMSVGAQCNSANCATANNFFNGQIDELTITAEALTIPQVKRMHEHGRRALQSHGTNDFKNNLDEAGTGTGATDDTLAVDVQLSSDTAGFGPFAYVASGTTAGADDGWINKVDLGSDTVTGYYTTATDPALSDNDATSLSVSPSGLELVGYDGIGANSPGLTANNNNTSGTYYSKTTTIPDNISAAYGWVNSYLDPSCATCSITVSASNDGGSNYVVGIPLNTDTNQDPSEKEYFFTFNTPGNSLKLKIDLVRDSSKDANIYVTKYGLTWFNDDDVAGGTTNGGLFTGSDTTVAHGEYVEVQHFQGTNDLLANGWFYDASSSAWLSLDEDIGVNHDTTTALLKGYWKMEETSGDLTDQSGFNHTLIDKGTPTYAQAGKVEAGNAITFNGTDSYFCTGSGTTCADDADFDFAGDFTVGGWFKRGADIGTTIEILLSKYTTNDGIFQVVAADNQLEFHVFQNASATPALTAASTIGIGDNNWHYIVAQLKGSDAKLYLDGKLVATDDTITGTRDTDSAASFVVGYRHDLPGATNIFEGTADDVFAYGTALTEQQINSLYEFGEKRYRIVQIDDNTVRLYNYSGSSKNLRLDVTTGGNGSDAGCDTCVSLSPTVADIDSGVGSNSIWINKTVESGRLLRLQNDAVDRFTIGWDGHATLSGNFMPGGDNLFDLGATASGRWRDLYLGPDSLHIQCTTGDGCDYGISYTMNISDVTNAFSIKQNGTDRFSIGNNGNVGIGSTPSNTYKLAISYTDTNPSISTLYGVLGQSLATITSANTTTQIGVLGNGQTIPSTGITHTATVYGLYGQSVNSGAGTLTSSVGIQALSSNTSTGSITTAFGMLVNILDGSGTVGTGYGVYIDDLEATTEYGIYQEAATDQNFFGGTVSIGTINNVTTGISVANSGATLVSSEHVAAFSSDAITAGNAMAFFTTDDASAANEYLLALRSEQDSTPDNEFLFASNGTLSLDNATLATPADLAEMYWVNGVTEPGDLVAIETDTTKITDAGKTLRLSSGQTYDGSVVGIVSTHPGSVLGYGDADSVDPDNDLRQPVALAGRVPLKVSLENGPIKAGDKLTSSSQPGVAMKATQAGRVVGYALEDYDGTKQLSDGVKQVEKERMEILGEGTQAITPPTTGIGKIMIFVDSAWYDPNININEFSELNIALDGDSNYSLTDSDGNIVSSIVSAAQGKIANLTTGVVNTKNLYTDGLTIMGKSLEQFVDERINLVLSNTSFISPLTDADNLAAKSITTDLIRPQSSNDILVSLTSTTSAEKGTLYIDGDASISGELIANTAKFNTLEAEVLKGKAIDDLRSTINDLKSNISTDSSTLTSDHLVLTGLTSDYGTFNQFLTKDLFVEENLISSNLSVDPDNIDQTLYLQPAGTGSINLLAGLLLLNDSGDVTLNGNLTVTGKLVANDFITNTATISSTLNIGTPKDATISGGFGKLLAIYDEQGEQVASVDASGSAQFKDIKTSQIIIAASQESTSSTQLANTSSSATIGSSTIVAGETEIVITNNLIKEGTLIYLTPISDTSNQVLYVKSKLNNTSFTVAINGPTTSDINFNYWLIQTQ